MKFTLTLVYILCVYFSVKSYKNERMSNTHLEKVDKEREKEKEREIERERERKRERESARAINLYLL